MRILAIWIPGRALALCGRVGNTRENGAWSLAVSCWRCHHGAVLNADPWPDHMPVPAFGPYLRSRWNCPACGDALNFVVLDDDDGIGDCAVSVPQLSELHGFGRRRRVWRESEREGEDENAKTKRRNACGESHRLSSVVLARLPQPPRSRKHVSVQEVRSIGCVTSGPPPISAIAASCATTTVAWLRKWARCHHGLARSCFARNPG